MINQKISSEHETSHTDRTLTSNLIYLSSLGVFFISATIIIYLIVMTGTGEYRQLITLTPIIGIAHVLSLIGILGITVRQTGWRVFLSTAFILPLIISALGIGVHRYIWHPLESRDEDIYFTFTEGERLLEGKNPYERILTGDMRNNKKYATYLPMFYQLTNWTQALGLAHFARWLLFWREIFLFFNIAIGVLLFYVPYKRGSPILAIFASLFWLFNRWTLTVTISSDFDFIPMFFLILGLITFPKRLWLSGLLIGLSLSLKHFGIYLVPVLLIIAWQTKNMKQGLIYFVTILTIPLLVSMPFLLSNWKPFILSILFSATRNPFSSLGVDSLDALLGWVGLPAKLPMLGLFGLVYALAMGFKRQVYVLSLLVMSVFVFFNSIFYPDYIMYMVPFIPLAASEALVKWVPEISLEPA